MFVTLYTYLLEKENIIIALKFLNTEQTILFKIRFFIFSLRKRGEREKWEETLFWVQWNTSHNLFKLHFISKFGIINMNINLTTNLWNPQIHRITHTSYYSTKNTISTITYVQKQMGVLVDCSVTVFVLTNQLDLKQRKCTKSYILLHWLSIRQLSTHTLLTQ